jgi:hypothetical protein
MIKALKRILLCDQINSYGGLSEPRDNINLQKPLFCFTRALLRKCTGLILVLIEETGSVDRQSHG